MQPELSPEQKQAVELKEKGNDAYKHKRFDEALNFYSQAIELDPQNMLLYTNKAGTYSHMHTINVNTNELNLKLFSSKWANLRTALPRA